MLKRYLLIFIFPLLGLSASQARVMPVAIDQLSPSAAHQRTTELVVYFMRNNHYRKKRLDDALSATIFDQYIESLDPNKHYFLSSDLKQLERFRHQLDNALNKRDLRAPFSVFRLFRARFEQRIKFANRLIDQNFDFKRKESYFVDRSEEDWVNSEQQLNEIWRKRVKNDLLSLVLADKDLKEAKKLLHKRYARLSDQVTQLDSDDVFQSFINAYTAVIEPHTSYFSRQASDNFRIHMSLSLEGIGAALQNENEYTVVRRIIAGGPAELSGLLHVGDRIVSVAQGDAATEDIIGWRLGDVVDLIRGEKGSTVKLNILPVDVSPEDPTKTITLVRDKINLEEQAAKLEVNPIKSGRHQYQIGVIRLPTFYTDFEARERGDTDFRSTSRDVKQLLIEAKQQKVDGLVIDLRGNGGGSLAEVTEMAGMFIDTGPIVQVKDTTGEISLNNDPAEGVIYTGPLAVMVDKESASASEIFAGAMQDYRRAVIIGEPTFGKGTVQRLLDLNRFTRNKSHDLGRLKFTIAQFFRINGDSTQHRGVVPDIIFPTAIYSTDQGERSLEYALPWAAIKAADHVDTNSYGQVIDLVREKHRQRIEKTPGFDYLLAEAEARKQSSEIKSVSLNQKDRKQRRQTIKQDRLDRLNSYRKTRGLSRLTGDEDPEKLEKEDKQQDDDILRDEAINILADSIWIKDAALLTSNINPLLQNQ